MRMLRLVAFLLLCSVVSMEEVNTKDTSSCSKAAKAESYLETAAAMIDKVREHFPTGAGDDCSCPPRPMDCEEVSRCGHNRSGVFRIWPRNRILRGSVDVFCDLESNGGGWTLIQRRGDYKRPADFFTKSWHQYKSGFGDLQRDFWLGNDNIYALTNQRKYYLRIELTDFENNTRYAFYDQFWIDNEDQSYKLHVYDFSGDAGDSFQQSDGRNFSTIDRDIENCSNMLRGGWWYASCGSSNLNGQYVTESTKGRVKALFWNSWKGPMESLRMTEIKIRPSDFRTSLLDLFVDPK